MLKTLSTAAVMALALAGGASAATLTVVGGTSLALPGNFDPAPPVPGVATGTLVTNFTTATIAGAGLFIDGPATITVEFLGKEAGFSNTAMSAGGATLQDDVVGASITYTQASAGLVDFQFATDSNGDTVADGTIINGVSATSAFLDLAFTAVSGDGMSVIALFGDGGGGDDNDFDDMVVRISVSAIPVPAAGLLLLGALGGLGALRRRKAA